MVRTPVILRRGRSSAVESPFWISYADLMTALMVLFLVVMSVALVAVTKTVSRAERQKAVRDQEIDRLMAHITGVAAAFPGMRVDPQRHVVDFGDRARFDTNSHQLTREQARALRAFVPTVLQIARDDLGRKWLKQIVVEGFADPRGTYLFNLNLSINRAQRVLCVLLEPAAADERPLREEELEQIRELFLVGGYSFNSARASLEESRRIELRLEFLEVNESRVPMTATQPGTFGACAI